MNCLICQDGMMKERMGTCFSAPKYCYVIIDMCPAMSALNAAKRCIRLP